MANKPNKKRVGPPDKLLKTSKEGKADIELKEEDLGGVSGGTEMHDFSFTQSTQKSSPL